MMRKSNEQTIGEAIREFLKRFRLENKLDEVALMHNWEDVAGPMVNKHTINLYVKYKTLYVSVDSPALRNELNMSRTRIIRSLNKKMGKDVIENIVFK